MDECLDNTHDLPESSNRVPEVSGQHHQFQEESRDFLGNLVNPTQIFDYSPWPPQAWITLLQFDEELYFWHVLWDTLRQKWGHEPWSQYKTERPTEYTILGQYILKWQSTRGPRQTLPDLGIPLVLLENVAATQEWLEYVRVMVAEVAEHTAQVSEAEPSDCGTPTQTSSPEGQEHEIWDLQGKFQALVRG